MYYGNREFYFDKYGKVFPTSTLASCDVLVAGGNFKQPLRRDSLSAQVLELVEVARFLDENSKYSPMVDQIYSQAEGSVCLAPKLGNFTIELGDAQNLEEKFSNLLSFYCNGLPRAGWNTYSRISLKFNGQVVCTRAKNVRQ
jgi:cell division protein FtsQ